MIVGMLDCVGANNEVYSHVCKAPSCTCISSQHRFSDGDLNSTMRANALHYSHLRGQEYFINSKQFILSLSANIIILQTSNRQIFVGQFPQSTPLNSKPWHPPMYHPKPKWWHQRQQHHCTITTRQLRGFFKVAQFLITP